MSQWISIDDMLPPESGKVLMTDGKRIYMSSRNAMCRTADGLHEIPENYGSGAVITHWMPLPEPPEDGK